MSIQERVNKRIFKKNQKCFPNKCVLYKSLLRAKHSTIGTVWFKTIRLLLIHNKTNAKQEWGYEYINENGRIKAVFLRNVWELPHDGSVSDRTPQPVICSRPRSGNNWNVGFSGGSVVGLVIQLMWWRVAEIRGGVMGARLAGLLNVEWWGFYYIHFIVYKPYVYCVKGKACVMQSCEDNRGYWGKYRHFSKPRLKSKCRYYIL